MHICSDGEIAFLEDLERWTIAIAHPKGEGSWSAAGAEASVLPFAQQAVLDYLDERRALIGDEEYEALIPFRRWDGTLTYWSEPMLRKLKGKIARVSGVKFSLKTFRATFAQLAIGAGVPIEAVSRALDHASTRTTEKYYARIRADRTFLELRRAFETPKVQIVPETRSMRNVPWAWGERSRTTALYILGFRINRHRIIRCHLNKPVQNAPHLFHGVVRAHAGVVALRRDGGLMAHAAAHGLNARPAVDRPLSEGLTELRRETEGVREVFKKLAYIEAVQIHLGVQG